MPKGTLPVLEERPPDVNQLFLPFPLPNSYHSSSDSENSENGKEGKEAEE